MAASRREPNGLLGATPAAVRLRHSLSGPAPAIDPVRDAVLGNLADIALAGKVFVPHYAQPEMYRSTGAATLRADGNDAANVRGDLPAGSEFAVLDVTGGWAWGYRLVDHLVGHVEMAEVVRKS